MIKCLILDLDGTLIDTTALQSIRDQGRWKEIASSLNRCSVHSEVIDVLATARSAGLKLCIVTNSPSNYARQILSYFNLNFDYVVAYHDVDKHKPDPEAIEKVLTRFQIGPDEAVYLGDSLEDSLASKAANVPYFAVEWSNPKHVPNQNFGVNRLLEYIGLKNSSSRQSQLRSTLIQKSNHFFLGYYLGGIKREIWSFKAAEEKSVDRWTKKVLELSAYLPQVNYVVRAFGHAETSADEDGPATPLDKLSLQLATVLQAEYRPDCLLKDRILVKSTQCSAIEREQQVHGAYSVNKKLIGSSISSPVTFLIVDDVYTTGATTREIARAIELAYPHARIYILTLVKTLYRSQASQSSVEAQHNSQLFTDLYSPGIKVPSSKPATGRKRRFEHGHRNLITKRYSANYSRTNHNFVFQNLKSFSIGSEPGSNSILHVVYVLKNMLQRGTPTIASRKLRAAFFGKEYFNDGEHHQALISKEPVLWNRLIRGDVKRDNFPAKRFFDELVPKYFGEFAFIKQLMLPEVQIFDMTQVYVEQFQNRQVDFYIPHVGLIIEIDGLQHNQILDNDWDRDEFTKSLGLKTVRFTTAEISNENAIFLAKIRSILDHIKEVDQLESSGKVCPPNGLTLRDYKTAYEHGVDPKSPLVRLTAAIRFQLLLLDLIENGEIRLGKQTSIVLVNRDKIDFAHLALDDLCDYLEHLLALIGLEGLKLSVNINELDEAPTGMTEKDICIDFSLLQRFDDSFQAQHNTIFVRTHYLDFYRYFAGGDANRIESFVLENYDFFEIACSQPYTYTLDLSHQSQHREALRYFLENLFLPFAHDVEFREGQIGIIASALTRVGTIGLLPTGSGKSVCYQIASILQPAISFVVCPIKSLMYDQKADLDAIGFTRCNYITGDLKADEKAKVQRNYGSGKYFFVLVSPERFQTHAFRAEMKAIGLDRSFAYAVIDEAHCLSEWGHDFRTSYLNLSNAISRLAPGASYIGLTATASVNVLKDIQTEFRITDDNILTPLDFTRQELSFHVIDDQGRKWQELLSIVQKMQTKWDSHVAPKAGIIFTQTVNTEKGCFELASKLSTSLGSDVRYFSGSEPSAYRSKSEPFESYKQKVQIDFKTGKYSLLAATKAFGMGINKGNVAYTIHYGLPASMEALYQEAGRAGRNKSLFRRTPADCFVLLTRERNLTDLDKIWDPSTTVSELKDSVSRLNRQGDINTILYLMTVNLDTINDEYKLLYGIYSFLVSHSEASKISLKASQFKTDKSRFEKAVYRLFQLGIVLDWVVEDFFNGKLEVEFVCLAEAQLTVNLEDAIQKYEPTFKLANILTSGSDFYRILNERLSKGSINKTQYVFLVLLLWSYDHFVYNRRQSLKTVYEQCSDLGSGRISESEFKFRLESYFKFNNSSYLLHSLAENSSDPSQWLSVFFDDSDESRKNTLITDSQIVALKEQISRFLESYRDNPCLNYISGILRLINDQFDDADGERRMIRSLDQLDHSNVTDDVLIGLISTTLKLKPLFSIESQCRYGKLIYERYGKQRILELINSEFEDPYTCRVLLSQISDRLENLDKIYRSIRL